MIDIAVLKALRDAGATVDMIIAAVEAAQKGEEAVHDAELERLAEKRERDRIRKRNQRARLRDTAGQDVTSAESLTKEPPSPTPPTQENPTPNKEKIPKRDPKEKRGSPLPTEWEPRQKEREFGRKLGYTDAQIDEAAASMRDWSLANANRAVARKLDWNATFRNWLRNNYAKRPGTGPPGNEMAAALDRLDDFVGRENERTPNHPTLDLDPISS